ncbi:GNAT family N-acetyltransferase [Helicobacter labetoulli]|uniref:GNAT family N-acetyltransferase n=1 Tax=Helicobacter labetoulli TaxID=2315333 RepID=UPI000EF75484|nr:GNAT family N-acetyltransferase [Helicobacter labetoulli]
MKKTQIRERLIMQQLDISHIEQFNELLRYAFQVTDSDLLEFGWNNEEIKRSKYPILQNASVLGWFDRQKLISQIALYPMQMNIYNRIYAMGGITGVATYPEYSGIGLMADLMREILKMMREKGQSISCLYPYSIPYYRSRGWEIVSDKMSFVIKDNQFPKPPQVGGMMQRVTENHPDLKALHNEFAAKTHGCLVRDTLAWNEYWRWDVEDTIVAIYYDESDKPTGYIVYLLENDIFKIKEMIYLNEEAQYGLWGYINAHQSMFDSIEGANFSNHNLAFLLEDGHIKESIQPYIMARIVDVEQFLTQYPFEFVKSNMCLRFSVSDPLLEWNNRDFILHFKDGELALEIVASEIVASGEKQNLGEYHIKLDIQTLVTMLLGYKRPLYLRSINRLQANDESIDKLEEILPEGKAYFSDYF